MRLCLAGLFSVIKADPALVVDFVQGKKRLSCRLAGKIRHCATWCGLFPAEQQLAAI